MCLSAAVRGPRSFAVTADLKMDMDVTVYIYIQATKNPQYTNNIAGIFHAAKVKL